MLHKNILFSAGALFWPFSLALPRTLGEIGHFSGGQTLRRKLSSLALFGTSHLALPRTPSHFLQGNMRKCEVMRGECEGDFANLAPSSTSYYLLKSAKKKGVLAGVPGVSKKI